MLRFVFVKASDRIYQSVSITPHTHTYIHTYTKHTHLHIYLTLQHDTYHTNLCPSSSFSSFWPLSHPILSFSECVIVCVLCYNLQEWYRRKKNKMVVLKISPACRGLAISGASQNFPVITLTLNWPLGAETCSCERVLDNWSWRTHISANFLSYSGLIACGQSLLVILKGKSECHQ